MSFSVDAAWSVPHALTALPDLAGRDDLEMLYVRVPFGGRLQQSVSDEAHRDLLDRVGRVLAGLLGVGANPHGIYRWPPDDFIAWRVCKQTDLNADELTQAIRDAVAAQIPEHVGEIDELIVAAVPLRFQGRDDLERAYAGAVRSAHRAAADPAGYRLECSATLLDRALASQSFCFHHQPIVDAQTRGPIAYEALCRGTMEGMIFPDLIFGVAERTSRVLQIGRVLREIAARELATTEATNTLHFLNIHPLDIDDPQFLAQTQGCLAPFANRIVFELTERAAIGDYRRVQTFFAKLRERGYRLAIDDLGSGYAGLTSLAELDPDFVKFDMSLIRNLHQHPVKQRLLRRMHQFAQEIGAQTISEGIENEEERDAVLATGCRLMQGYFFARPARGFCSVPEARFEGTLDAVASLATCGSTL